MKARGCLKNNAVVATVMSNLGFEKAMNDNGIRVFRSQVGDRYVIDEMQKQGCNLGGEQSGHIIFGDFNSTGDGTISGLQIISMLKQSGKKLSELKQCMSIWPQLLENLKVKEKKPVEELQLVQQAIKQAETDFCSGSGGSSSSNSKGSSLGRVLVRYSGTENKLRVMVEGKDMSLVKKHLASIINAAKQELA
jgi:phosphoglucosamine mutase